MNYIMQIMIITIIYFLDYIINYLIYKIPIKKISEGRTHTFLGSLKLKGFKTIVNPFSVD